MDELRAELVLRAAESVPAGRIAPYGMLGRITGTGARFVGRVMAVYGREVPWWRVTNAKGELPPELLARAREKWHLEGIPLDPPSARIRRCLADEDELRCRWEPRITDIVEATDPVDAGDRTTTEGGP